MARDEKVKLLRVGIFQDQRSVEERLIYKHGDVSIGQGAKNTFIIPSPTLPKTVTLFEARGTTGYELVFEHGMEGRIDLGDEPMTLAELARSPKAKRRGSKFVVPLSGNARGKLTIGNVALLFQFVDPPPVMPRPQLPAAAKGGITSQLEWPLVYILVVAFLVLGGGGAGLDFWWKDTGQYLVAQFDDRGDKLYELLKAEVRIEKKAEEPKPTEEKPVEDKVEDVAEAQPEVKPAEPPPKPTAKREAAKTPAERQANREKLTAKVRNTTFLHVLGSNSGDGIAALDTLKDGVHAANLENAFNLPGGVTEADEGSSSFVGGPSATTADGGRYKTLSQGDTGGDRITTQTVTTQNKDSGSEIKVRARVGGGQVSGQQGTGSIDKDAVARVFQRRKGAIQHCYEKGLQLNKSLRGKVTIRFTIGTAGRITDISAAENTTGDSEVARCIMDKVKGWRFDPPQGGAVTFSYPFLLDTK